MQAWPLACLPANLPARPGITVPYPAHFTVAGMNGFYLAGTANCWVRDVRPPALHLPFLHLVAKPLRAAQERRAACECPLLGPSEHGFWCPQS